MPISSHLLERAYQLIKARQYENAELVLDAVVRVDPRNVEAWKTYLQIHRDVNDLYWLKERILKTKDLSDTDKKYILDYQNYLIQQWAETKVYTVTEKYENTLPSNDYDSEQGEPVTLELIDIYNYPEQKVEKIRTRKPRRRYSSVISAASGYAVILFALFLLGIRLLAIQPLLGYALLGIFVFGGMLWLQNYSVRMPVTFTGAARTFSLENKHEISIVDRSQGKLEEGKQNREKTKKVKK